MRRKLQAKLNSKKGFTLVELLIVVAIIAILVAVSIPMVGGSLEKARKATDQANERAARAAALVTYMTDDNFTEGDITYWYDAENGTVEETESEVHQIQPYGQSNGYTGMIVRVTISGGGDNVTVKWVTPAQPSDNPGKDIIGIN